MSGTEIGLLAAQGFLSGIFTAAKILAPYFIAFCLLCVLIARKKKSPPKSSSKKRGDLFGLNKPEEHHKEQRAPKRRTPHPTSDKFINKNKKSNYRVVIYKHEPKLPIWLIVLICLATFALSFVLASIFL